MGEVEIAAIALRIAEIDALIAQLLEARGQSVDPSERARLDAQIASLQETRQALDDELINIQFPPEGASVSI